ncbi:hypothetical protein TrLO_g1440 [Triparma laevis f. longispina]|uniref:Uncharacterized protein n=1 Tax=Triparma laevis f. longispina TaxID=1714387 RepID=A0A9W7FQ12_9STRA|nr:hypothetical protein TrLO_g1440 [Triparma laevis f. longispina]
MIFRDILLIKKELHKFYDVNRADGPFVVAGKLFNSLIDPNEKHEVEGLTKNNAAGDANASNDLLKIMMAKDSELRRQMKAENNEKEAEIARLNNIINTASLPPNLDVWISHTDDQ